MFKKIAKNETSTTIKNQGLIKGKNFFNFYYTPLIKPWFHNKNLKRDMIVTVNRCRAEHYNLNFSLHKINIVNDPSCECGFESQDLNHIIWQCPIYDIFRIELLKKLSFHKIYPPLDIKSFITEPNIVIMNYIFEYLKKCNLHL